MNLLGKIGVALFLSGWVCFFGLFVAGVLEGPDFILQVLLVPSFFVAPLGFILMFISVLYDRYKQLETEQIRPKV